MDERFVTMLRPFLRFLPEGRTPTETDRLHDLGLDSMQAIELLFAVEDTFGVSLPDELLVDATFETAGSLWRAIVGSAPDVDAGTVGSRS